MPNKFVRYTQRAVARFNMLSPKFALMYTPSGVVGIDKTSGSDFISLRDVAVSINIVPEHAPFGLIKVIHQWFKTPAQKEDEANAKSLLFEGLFYSGVFNHTDLLQAMTRVEQVDYLRMTAQKLSDVSGLPPSVDINNAAFALSAFYPPIDAHKPIDIPEPEPLEEGVVTSPTRAESILDQVQALKDEIEKDSFDPLVSEAEMSRLKQKTTLTVEPEEPKERPISIREKRARRSFKELEEKIAAHGPAQPKTKQKAKTERKKVVEFKDAKKDKPASKLDDAELERVESEIATAIGISQDKASKAPVKVPEKSESPEKSDTPEKSDAPEIKKDEPESDVKADANNDADKQSDVDESVSEPKPTDEKDVDANESEPSNEAKSEVEDSPEDTDGSKPEDDPVPEGAELPDTYDAPDIDILETSDEDEGYDPEDGFPPDFEPEDDDFPPDF